MFRCMSQLRAEINALVWATDRAMHRERILGYRPEPSSPDHIRLNRHFCSQLNDQLQSSQDYSSNQLGCMIIRLVILHQQDKMKMSSESKHYNYDS